MLSDVFNSFIRLCLYGQIRPSNPKENLYERLLVTRNMAFAAVFIVSQVAFHGADLDEHNHTTIIHDCIVPRIEKGLACLEQNRRMRPRRGLLGANELTSEKKYESRVAHIELMVYLVTNRGSFGPKFWASIAKWQIETYRSFCEKLLRDYKDATRDLPEDKDGVGAFIAALEKAVKRAYALPEPDPEKARLSDAFSIRNIYDDHDVKALISSDRFTPEKRLKLQEAVEELLMEQPMFPPESYALRRI